MQRQPTSVAPREGFQTIGTNRVSDPEPKQRAGQRACGASGDNPYDIECAFRGGEPGERHDQFGGNGREYVLHQHEKGDGEIAAALNPTNNPIEHERPAPNELLTNLLRKCSLPTPKRPAGASDAGLNSQTLRLNDRQLGSVLRVATRSSPAGHAGRWRTFGQKS